MHNCIQMNPAPKGPQAARLRQRKFQLLARFAVPEDLLAGSLTQTHRRCGKPTCHCAQGEGHPIWFLTFMRGRKRRVERIPQEWVEELRPLVEAGREFKDAVAEILAINSELLVLWRKQKRK